MADGLPVGDMSSLEKSNRMAEKGYVSCMEVCCPPEPVKPTKPAAEQAPHNINMRYLRASVHPEMKDCRYRVEIAVRVADDGRILAITWAKCECPAGRGPLASCKHIGAFCYRLATFCSNGFTCEADVSVTSKLMTWNIPRKRKLDAKEAENLDFCRKKRPVLLSLHSRKVHVCGCMHIYEGISHYCG